MTNSRFLELLNLYLDDEISDGDLEQLQAEIRRSASRRRIYEDYCRLDRACSALASDFTSRRERRSVSQFLYAAAGLAAAVALVTIASRNLVPTTSDLEPFRFDVAVTAEAVRVPLIPPTVEPAEIPLPEEIPMSGPLEVVTEFEEYNRPSWRDGLVLSEPDHAPSLQHELLFARDGNDTSSRFDLDDPFNAFEAAEEGLADPRRSGLSVDPLSFQASSASDGLTRGGYDE